MVGAVRHLRAENLDDGPHAAFANRIFGFDDERARAHAHQHAVAAAIERQSRVLDLVLRGGGARGYEARTHPFHQIVGRKIVGADDDHAAAAPEANPVFGNANRRRGRRAGRVYLGVRPANAQHLGELRMAHRQHLEDEATVELERFALLARFVKARDFAGEVVEARERRREDHTGFVGHGERQPPAVGQVAARGGATVVANQGNASVTQRFDTSANGQRRGDVENLGTLLGDAKLLGQVEGTLAPSQSYDFVDRLNRLQARLADFALVQAND